VQTLLSAANLQIFSFKKETVAAEKPAWCEFPGKIWNDLNVTLHLLIPTVSCLASGSMEDYRNLADVNTVSFLKEKICRLAADNRVCTCLKITFLI
jgi:hypothetical protein